MLKCRSLILSLHTPPPLLTRLNKHGLLQIQLDNIIRKKMLTILFSLPGIVFFSKASNENYKHFDLGFHHNSTEQVKCQFDIELNDLQTNLYNNSNRLKRLSVHNSLPIYYLNVRGFYFIIQSLRLFMISGREMKKLT